ncbi:hypothetical protein Acr_26g0000350 [Actinidia rufa]|uniref:Uncharacterized protein n=1 Tax=Actinidia rufa TaxID=165716 RepID=A0A7J0H170_9ERIC|nr:hypothetical protein Acr_26g0000350 [Actinidia rufa]
MPNQRGNYTIFYVFPSWACPKGLPVSFLDFFTRLALGSHPRSFPGNTTTAAIPTSPPPPPVVTAATAFYGGRPHSLPGAFITVPFSSGCPLGLGTPTDPMGRVLGGCPGLLSGLL